ncbi:MAG: EAL domain-containing protein [Alphaproteobacteria bacterium]
MDNNKLRLIEQLKFLKDKCQNHFAVHFHFSKLKENNKSEYQTKISINIINVFFRNHEIDIFVLKDGDIVVIYQNEDKEVLRKVIFELRYLFIDDPLAFKSEGIENPDFCTSYYLLTDWEKFFNNLNNDSSVKATEKDFSRKKTTVLELTANSLFSIESDIMNAEILPLMRTQNIVALSTNIPRPLFSEIYVSIAHLCHSFDYQLKTNPNSILFRYLTHRLDEQVLEMLKNKINSFSNKSISINLNINTILSEKFYSFDKVIQPAQKTSIIIEINVSDVFSNISAFITAKEYLQKSGYKVCLDGLNNLSFNQLDRESLGFDLVKLQWNCDTISSLGSNENLKLIKSIKKCGVNRIILCRCDNEDAIEYGKALGISLFQGWHVDKMVNNLR